MVDDNKLHALADDDDAWLASLSGRARPLEVDREVQVLRELMIENERQSASRENVEHDWHQLRFALKREERMVRPRWFNGAQFAQAAMLLVAIVGVYQIAPREDASVLVSEGSDEPVMRGKYTQEIYSPEPSVLAKQWYGRFQELHVPVQLKSTAESTELKVELTYPVPEAVRDVFAQEEIRLPERGDLYLLFYQQATTK